MIASPPGTKPAAAGPALNEAQRQAVEHGAGPLLVLAGAGSGKTRVLTARIARLIGDGTVRADQVLAVTFTNKAAGEMRERIGRLLGSDPAGMWVGTFHAIGARMLRANAPLVGRTNAFTIYDEDDTLAVVKRLMERHRVSPKTWTPRAIAAAISAARNALVDPAEYERLAQTPLETGRRSRLPRPRRRVSRRERRELRRPARPPGPAAGRQRGRAPAIREAIPRDPRGRVPGHEPRAVRVRPAARRAARRGGRRRRRRPVHLRLARRRRAQHPRLRARLSVRAGRAPRGELSLDAAGARAGERRHQRERGAARQGAARDAPRRRAGLARRRARRPRRGGLHRLGDRAAADPERRTARVERHPLSHERAEPPARGVAAPPRDPVPPRGRRALLRPARDQGPARLASPDRESRGRRSVPARDHGAAPRHRRDDRRGARGSRQPARDSRCSRRRAARTW